MKFVKLLRRCNFQFTSILHAFPKAITNFSMLRNIESATSKPPITKNESTAMGWIVTRAEKSVLFHLPSVANTLELTFGKPRLQLYRWPNMMWSMAKVLRPERQWRMFDDSLRLMSNSFAPFLYTENATKSSWGLSERAVNNSTDKRTFNGSTTYCRRESLRVRKSCLITAARRAAIKRY